MIDVYDTPVPVEIRSLIRYKEDNSDVELVAKPKNKKVAKIFEKYRSHFIRCYDYEQQRLNPTRNVFDQFFTPYENDPNAVAILNKPYDEITPYLLIDTLIDWINIPKTKSEILHAHARDSFAYEALFIAMLAHRARQGISLAYAGSYSAGTIRPLYKGLRAYACETLINKLGPVTIDLPKFGYTVNLEARYEPYTMFNFKNAIPRGQDPGEKRLVLDILVNREVAGMFDLLDNTINNVASFMTSNNRTAIEIVTCGRCTMKKELFDLKDKEVTTRNCKLQLCDWKVGCTAYYLSLLNLVDDVLWGYYTALAGQVDTKYKNLSVYEVSQLKVEREQGVDLLPQDYAALFAFIPDGESRKRVLALDLPKQNIDLDFYKSASNEELLQRLNQKMSE